MGAARKARLAAAKHNLKLIQGGKRDETKPIMQPVPTARVVDLHILVPKDMDENLTNLYEYVKRHFETRNDFLVACLHDGMVGAAEALKAAVAAKKAAESQGEIKVVSSLADVNLPPVPEKTDG